jgi:hypothetical protein
MAMANTDQKNGSITFSGGTVYYVDNLKRMEGTDKSVMTRLASLPVGV